MIAEKVFAEGVAKDIRNYLPPEYEDADFQVVQKNKNNGIQLIGVQVNLPERNASPIIYMEQFFDEIRQLMGMENHICMEQLTGQWQVRLCRPQDLEVRKIRFYRTKL